MGPLLGMYFYNKLSKHLCLHWKQTLRLRFFHAERNAHYLLKTHNGRPITRRAIDGVPHKTAPEQYNSTLFHF